MMKSVLVQQAGDPDINKLLKVPANEFMESVHAQLNRANSANGLMFQRGRIIKVINKVHELGEAAINWAKTQEDTFFIFHVRRAIKSRDLPTPAELNQICIHYMDRIYSSAAPKTPVKPVSLAEQMYGGKKNLKDPNRYGGLGS